MGVTVIATSRGLYSSEGIPCNSRADALAILQSRLPQCIVVDADGEAAQYINTSTSEQRVTELKGLIHGRYPDKPDALPDDIIEEPDVSRFCVPTKPSYAEAKARGVIAMNPYAIRRKQLVRKEYVPIMKTTELAGGGEILTPSGYFGGFKATYITGGVHSYPSVNVSHKVDIKISGRSRLQSTRVIFSEHYGPPFQRVDPNLLEVVTTSLLAKASEADLDLSTTMAEFIESVNTFTSLIPNLIETISEMRRLTASIPAFFFSKKGRRRIRQLLREGKKIPDAVFQYWMLYRYGIMPAVYTFQDVEKALGRTHAKFTTVRTGNDAEQDQSGTKYLPSAILQYTYHVTNRTTGVWKGKNTFDTLSHKRTQVWLPTTLWELVPLSFVVDWFLNVGEYIQSLRPIVGAEASYCVGVKLVKVTRCHVEATPAVTIKEGPFEEYLPATRYTFTWTGIQKTGFEGAGTLYSSNETTFSRVVNPTKRSILPNINLNWKRMLDSAALLWSKGIR